jgi:hypothetical protein
LQTISTRSTHKEKQVSAFNGLKLVAAKRPQAATPVVQRRNKLSNQLWEQIELARAAAEGRTYAPIKLRNVVNKVTGERTRIEAAKRVKQWWFVADTGRVCLQVRYGTRVLELAKGKNSIEVGSGSELLSVLETVKKSVELGELDTQIEAASAAVRERFKN